jgi:release factor glutamine methyltransferase
MLVERGLAELMKLTVPRILDLGTGTGCIAISILCDRTAARAVATDLSTESLGVARANALRHGVIDRLDLRQGDWFSPLREEERFDLIVSNPPYIGSDEIAGLATEVRVHDPRLALDGGPDGLAPYRVIAAGATARLRPGGIVLVEIGASQGRAVRELFEAAGFGPVEVEGDLAGLDRMVVARRAAIAAPLAAPLAQ